MKHNLISHAVITLLVCVALGAVVSGCRKHTTGKRRFPVAATPVLDPIQNLQCEQIGFTDTATASWTLPSGTQYDEIRVQFADGPVTVLAGDQVTHTASFTGSPGDIEVCVEVVSGSDTAEECCAFIATQLPAVLDLECVPAGFSGDLDVTWDLPAGVDYDEVRIFLDDALITTLAGDATAASLQGLTSGSTVEICIEAYVALGDVVAESCCDVDVPELAAVEDLTCTTVGFAGAVTLDWVLPTSDDHGDYDQIRILIDAAEHEIIDATAVSYELTTQVPGEEITVSVEGSIESDVATVSCIVTPPILPTVVDLACMPLDKIGTGELSWTLPLDGKGNPDTDLYTEIRIVAGDSTLATLAGDATTTQVVGQVPGTDVEFCVEGYVAEDDVSTSECCTITFPELSPILNLECDALGFNGRADLTWDLPTVDDYEDIVITVDGDEVDTLDGTDTSYQVTELEPGTTSEVCVIGRFEDYEASVCCNVETPVLPPVADLECEVGGADLDEVTVTWTIPEVTVALPGDDVYDEIRIYVDDATDPTEVLSGDETSVTLTGFDREASAEITVEGYIDDGERVAADSCDAIFIPLPPDSDFRRGDIDQDMYTGIDDVIQILKTLQDGEPECLDAADIDNDGNFDAITDALFMLELLFLDLHEMPEPVLCGADIDDSLGCASYDLCD